MTASTRIEIDAALFVELMAELARRGRGIRESGAFLLCGASGDQASCGEWQRVTAIAYYDELDPDCLTGAITFTGDGYTALTATCRRDGLQIVADIHTHPGRWVGQSHTDAAHPMVALPGHVAIIAPHYARRAVKLTDLGVHHYHGNGQWTARYHDDIETVLRVVSQPEPRRLARALRRLAALMRRVLHLLSLRRYRP